MDDENSSSWLDSLSDYATTGANLYRTITGQPQTTAATPAAKPTNWLLIGGIAAAVLVLVLFITRK